MKKFISFVSVVLALVCIFAIYPKNKVSAQTQEFVVYNYAELKSAMDTASASNTAVITLANDIALESSITVKGNVIIKGNNKEKLIFDHNGNLTGFNFSKNTNLTLENIAVTRTIYKEQEAFMFSSYSKQINLAFNGCDFNVATAEIASVSYDRIVYCSSDVASTFVCYLNDCTFNTYGYFYRGTYVVYNCASLPTTAGSATVKEFSGLKIDYEAGKLNFPADITVSEDEEFTVTVKSGSALKSQFTYYALKDGFKFSFTTRNLQSETPTEASVNVDFAEEKVYFSEEYAVYANAGLTQEIASGESVQPGQTLYVIRKGSGIFIDSAVFEYNLPLRPEKRELKADFVCSFGFAMEHFNNCEYRVNGGAWQKAPVFVGLLANTEYTVEVRIGATASSFVSEIHTLKVTTSEN